jgi:type I restriction enzyme S subunit
MNNDWFFDKFALIADAPGAVERMRGLVFELAFSGKLSDNDHQNDNIVGGWIAKPIEEIATSITPGFACSRDHKDDDGHVHLRTHNISTEGRMNFDLLVRINTKMIDPKKASLGAGDVLFNNTNSQDLVGKTCLVDKDYNFAFSNHITRIKLRDEVFPAFVVYYLTHLRNKGYFSRICTRWINQAAVNTDALKRLSIPLPPLAEQKRIVAKVDELMGLCDALEAQQQERELRKSVLVRSSLSRFAEAPTPENLGYLFHKSYDIPPSELRKSILTLAVQGKLVPQDPNDEPARHIVKKLAITRMQYTPAKHVKNTAKLCDADDNRYIYDIPSSWTWCRFGDLVLDFRYGTSRKCDRNSGGVPVLRIPNIQNGRVDSTDLKFTSMPSAEFAELRLQADDILLVRSNGSEALVGKSAVVCPEDERFAYAGYLVRARLPKKEVFSKYLHVALSARVVRDQIEGPIRTTSGVKNINTKELSNLALPLPPLAEQHRIVTKVDQLMALVDELERQQDASRENASKLLDAIVQEMTNGGQGISATLES